MDELKAVEISLAPMFEKAEEDGLWFCRHDICFSPEELRHEQACGRFRWGAINWSLEDPKNLVEAAYEKAYQARKEAIELKERVASWEKGRR